MARLMACNDETDGGRDKRDMHVRGHYSSAARTHTHSYTQTENATQGCRRSRLPPTSLFFSPSFVFSLSPSCSSHPPSVPLCLLLFFSSLLRLQSVSSEDLHHSYQIISFVTNCETCFYHLYFKWNSNAQELIDR